MVAFTVYGKPEQAGSKSAHFSKHGTRFVKEDNPAAVGWKNRIASEAGDVFAETARFEGPVVLGFRFFMPRPKGHYGAKGNILPSKPFRPTVKPDLTKLIRGAEDALRGIAWTDDNQVIETHAEKWYADDGPTRLEIEIHEWLDASS